jgi:hypothetical protein
LCFKASFILWCENYRNKAAMDSFIFTLLHRFLEGQGIFKIFFCAPYIFLFLLDGPGIKTFWQKDFLHLSRWALGPTHPVFYTQCRIDFDYSPSACTQQNLKHVRLVESRLSCISMSFFELCFLNITLDIVEMCVSSLRMFPEPHIAYILICAFLKFHTAYIMIYVLLEHYTTELLIYVFLEPHTAYMSIYIYMFFENRMQESFTT